MDLTKWETKIVPVCPELDTGLRYTEQWGWHRPSGENVETELHSEDDAASLIFAGAVLWLADANKDAVVCITVNDRGQRSIQWNDEVNGWLSFDADTPVEAAYLAVCHVLGVTP